MSIQSINAQSLRPAVNFKAGDETETQTAKEKPDTSKVVGWSTAGVAALSAVTWGVIALHNKNAAKKFMKHFPKKYEQYRNVEHKFEGDKIVKEFKKMRKPDDFSTYATIRQELTHMDWNAKPLKREDVINAAKA